MRHAMVILIPVVMLACSQYDPGSGVPMERQREYAAVLFKQKLYVQSIDEYLRLLDYYKLDDNLRANINYTIGNIFFEQLGDYRNALSFFLKIKHIYRESSLIDDANMKLVASLERLGMSQEASAVLRETASLNESDSPFERLPGDTVAIVADVAITSGEFERIFNYYYNSIPDDQRNEDEKRNEKIVFLRDYIKNEVLYNSALRRNIDQEKNVLEVAYLQKKQLIIEQLLQEDIYSKIDIKDSEIENYYRENRDKLTERTADGKQRQMSLEDARDVIYQLLFNQQAVVLKDQLTDRLIEAQNARVFIDKVK